MALKAGYKGFKTLGPGLDYDSVTGHLFLNGESDISLDNLKDVSIDTPVDGDILIYDSTTGTWYNDQIDSDPTEDSSKPVSSGGVYNSIAATQNLIDDTVGWKSEQLFDRDDCTEGYYIGSDGTIGTSVKFMYTDLMLVSADEIYNLALTINESDAAVRVHGYDSNGDWVKQLYYKNFASTGTLDVDIKADGVSGIRISLPKSTTNTVFKHISVDTQKVDNSVIAPVENGTTASQDYAVGSHAIRNGAFITWKNAKAQGESISSSDYDSGDVADELDTTSKTITFIENITALSGVNGLFKKGNICCLFLCISYSSAISANTLFTLGTVPNDCIPRKSIFTPAFTGGTPSRLTLNTSGEIKVRCSQEIPADTDICATITYMV